MDDMLASIIDDSLAVTYYPTTGPSAPSELPIEGGRFVWIEMAAASAADHTELEGEDAAQWSQLAPDIHTLQSNPDRGARRAALAQLRAALLDAPSSSSSSSPPRALRALFTQRLQGPLLAVVGADPVEKCREMGAALLLALLKQPGLLPSEQGGGDNDDDAEQETAVTSVLAAYLPVVRRRLTPAAGGEEKGEGSEEVRLLLLRTLNILLARPGCWPLALRRPLRGGDGCGREEGRDGGACFADLAAVLARALGDAYPEAKQEACAALGYAARYANAQLRLHQATLLKPLLGNLAHQHARVRALALQALGHVLALGHDAMAQVLEEQVSPLLSQLVFDRNPPVRLGLARVVGAWLCQGKAGAAAESAKGEGEEKETGQPASPYHFEAVEPALLLLLLLLLSDETVSDVTTEARTQARAAGLAWIARRKARGAQRRLAHLRADGQSSDLEEMATGEGEEEEEEGGEDGALRCMVRSLFLPSLLPRVLDDVGHWTLRVRHRAVLLLADLISLGGPDQITAALPLVVRTLISTLVADGAEAEVDAAVEQAGRALGRTVPPGTLLEELLPQVRGERGAQVVHRAAALRLLHAFLQELVATATTAGLTNAEAAKLARSLAHADVLASDDEGTIALATAGPLADALAAAVRAAAGHCECSPSSPSRVVVDFLRATLPLLSLPADSDARRRTVEALNHLAGLAVGEEGLNKHERRALLLRRHFAALLEQVTSDGGAAAGAWGSLRTPGRVAFDALLRECPEGTFEHWDAVVAPLLSRQLLPPAAPPARAVGEGARASDGGGGDGEGRQVELRLAHLLLLDTLLRDPAAGTFAHPAMVRGIVVSMLQPNIVWRAGRAEATVRKAVLMALHAVLTMLRRRQETDALGPPDRLALLAPLRTALEEYDATARELATLCLEGVFVASGVFSQGHAGQAETEAEEVARRLLPELVKRLDDPSGDVRLAGCKALEALFSRYAAALAAGPHADAVEGALQRLAIHLADPQVENGVARALAVARGEGGRPDA